MKTIVCIITVSIAIIFIQPLLYASTAEFHNGIAEVAAQGRTGQTITVKLYAQKYDNRIPYKGSFRWGTEKDVPRYLITSIDISVDKKKLFVPLSAYCDLTNPDKASLKTVSNGYVLTIFGGDASTAYQANIMFDNALVNNRKVSHAEFPDVAWEKTQYSYNVK